MKQITLIFLIFFMGCLKQSEPIASERMIYTYPTLDSVYDLELDDDTLYVANGIDGLKILKINIVNKDPLDSLFEGNLVSEVERFVDVVLSESYIFLLEKLEFTNATTYALPKKFPIEIDKYAVENDVKNQSKIVYVGFSGYSDYEELIILKKHINWPDVNNRFSLLKIAHVSLLGGGYAEWNVEPIGINKFNEEGVNILHNECSDLVDCNDDMNGEAIVDNCGICAEGNTGLTPCSESIDCNGVENGNSYLNNCGNCVSVLNYYMSDIEYYKRNSGDYLYLTNSNEDTTSVQIFKRVSHDSFDFYKEDILSNRPLTIKVFEDAYIVGLADDSGAYIMLLDNDAPDDPTNDNFTIANGYTIQDIRYDESSNLLTLSAGNDGVLVYEWDGISMPIPIAMISSGYAYSALIYDNNKIIVGTKNGIEIYEI